MFILIDTGILRSSYDSVDCSLDKRWVGEGYSETRACLLSPSPYFIHCGSLDLRSSLISDEVVKFRPLVLAESQLQPTGLGLTSWGSRAVRCCFVSCGRGMAREVPFLFTYSVPQSMVRMCSWKSGTILCTMDRTSPLPDCVAYLEVFLS